MAMTSTLVAVFAIFHSVLSDDALFKQGDRHYALRYTDNWEMFPPIGVQNETGALFNNNNSIHTQTLYWDENLSWRRKRSIKPSNIVLTQHFTERQISPGDDVSLQCTANGERPPRFMWERDGTIISPNTDQRYTISQTMSTTGLGVVSQLNISRARVEDGGLYSCAAIEGDSNISHVARLDVYGPPYIRNLPPIKVQNGQPLKLRCPYYGYPISKIEWEHKGKKIVSSILTQHNRFKRNYENIWRKRKKRLTASQKTKHFTASQQSKYLTASRRIKRQASSQDGVLVIDKVDKEGNGEAYVCVVYTTSGEMARRSFEIQIVESPELDELRFGSGLKEGQIVQISCNIISGDPPIYFSWLKDGKKIPTSLKHFRILFIHVLTIDKTKTIPLMKAKVITERSSDLFSVLIIKRVSLEHCGRYTCIATNHVGKTNQTADLYINVAPKWLEEPSNSSILVGQRAVIHCSANGYPTPSIHWMKSDDSLGIWRPVLDLAGGGITSYSNGTLVIEIVSLSDEGLYSCSVDNGVGEALNKNIWVAVNKPVYFESSTTNITAKIGYQTQLLCLPLGDHPIRVKWTLNAKPMDFTNTRVKISESITDSGLSNSIDISYVESKDSGVYQCRASNPFGVAIHYVFLDVLEPPSSPIDLQLESVLSRSIKLSWRDMTSHTQYYSIQYNVWEHNKYINITRESSEIRQIYEIKDLQPSTEYKIHVAAGNQVDLSKYTEPIYVTTLQEAPSSSPISIQVQQTDNPGELYVSWSPPPRDAQNGQIQGYHVRVEPRTNLGTDSEDKTKTVKVLSRKGKLDTLLSGLLKNTRFAVSISAFNAAGNGPYSLPVYQTTREGAPEQSPNSLECSGISSTSLRLSWQPIAIRGQGGSLTGYIIMYSLEDDVWYNSTSSQTEIYLPNLSKFTNYTVKVAGYSSFGTGPFSYPIACSTLQDVPNAPALIKVLTSSPTSLVVSWTAPGESNGVLTHYTVYIKPAHSSNQPKSFKVPAQESNLRTLKLELKELTDSKLYEVYVTASTSIGEGARTNVVMKELTNKVVAGISSIGSTIHVGVGSSILLTCELLGVPYPRAIWYHNNNIITNHPRFTRNHDDSLLINNIDQSLSGNYTCLAKNLYGSDFVSYILYVLNTPESPVIRAVPYKDSIHVEWDQPPTIHGDKTTQKITYSLSWKEANGSWQDSLTGKTVLTGTSHYIITGVKCGTQYLLRIAAENNVGSSTPAYLNVHTLGGVAIPPTNVEWFWSNSSQIYIQLSGWDDNGCEITNWMVDYRTLDETQWIKADNKIPRNSWSHFPMNPTSYVIGDLLPAQWYQVKVTAHNSAGSQTTVYNYATTTVTGETIGPPSEYFDLNMIVIICSSILLTLCFVTCIYILIKRHSNHQLTEYRNSLTTECKSESGNITDIVNDSNKENNRIYSAPVHLQDAKHELYEISPYAQFALGFRTFGHVDNQEPPRPVTSTRRYDSETSFQMRSESEESDYMSRNTTLKSAPRKPCRIPHHHR